MDNCCCYEWMIEPFSSLHDDMNWMIEPFGSLHDAMNYVMQDKIYLGTR
jgi:hypothetical protein